METKKIIKRVVRHYLNEQDNLENEKQYKVFESKYYYSTYKEILFIGSYDECIQFFIKNSGMSLEMLPIENDSVNIKENSVNENNLAIIGSRNFNNYSYAKTKILEIIKNYKIPISKIISGGANGADKIAEIFAKKFNIPIEVISADWSEGKKAGVIRNTDIIKKSDYVIAFWDGQSKGTLDSINKAKRLNKRLFIVKISPNDINEGVRIGGDNEYIFDFNNDEKTDVLTLKYNNNYITSKKINGVISYFSFKINKNIDKKIRFNLLSDIKTKSIKDGFYDNMLNKAVVGLFNNPNFEVGDTDLILIPESSSSLNLDLANKVKNKIPNAMFAKDIILKNEPKNVQINHEKLIEKGYKKETILEIEKMVDKSVVGGVFKIKKIPPRFRKFILNFLKIDIKNRELLNKLVNGKIIIIDDFVSEGTTFNEVNRLLENYAPKEIILFSLIG